MNNTYLLVYAFDNNNGTLWVGAENTIPVWCTFYNPIPLKISNVQILHQNPNLYPTKAQILGSNDNITFTEIGNYISSTYNSTVNISCSYKNSYKYIRYNISTAVGGRCDTTEIIIHGQIDLNSKYMVL